LTYYDYHGAYRGKQRTCWRIPDRVTTPRENTTLVMLVRNLEVDNMVRSVYELEDRFNRKYDYP
jgi:hypothetical protein